MDDRFFVGLDAGVLKGIARDLGRVATLTIEARSPGKLTAENLESLVGPAPSVVDLLDARFDVMSCDPLPIDHDGSFRFDQQREIFLGVGGDIGATRATFLRPSGRSALPKSNSAAYLPSLILRLSVRAADQADLEVVLVRAGPIDANDAVALDAVGNTENELAGAGLEGQAPLGIDLHVSAGELVVARLVKDDDIVLLNDDIIRRTGNHLAAPRGRIGPRAAAEAIAGDFRGGGDACDKSNTKKATPHCPPLPRPRCTANPELSSPAGQAGGEGSRRTTAESGADLVNASISSGNRFTTPFISSSAPLILD